MNDDALEARLVTLRAEYDKGQQVLADLEREAQEMRDQMLRIAGAIQVLDELTGTAPSDPSAEEA